MRGVAADCLSDRCPRHQAPVRAGCAKGRMRGVAADCRSGRRHQHRAPVRAGCAKRRMRGVAAGCRSGRRHQYPVRGARRMRGVAAGCRSGRRHQYHRHRCEPGAPNAGCGGRCRLSERPPSSAPQAPVRAACAKGRMRGVAAGCRSGRRHQHHRHRCEPGVPKAGCGASLQAV
jgi:hypothetical protein